MSLSDEQQTDSEWPLHIMRMCSSFKDGRVLPHTQTLHQQNSSLVWNLSSFRCPQMAGTQTEHYDCDILH